LGGADTGEKNLKKRTPNPERIIKHRRASAGHIDLMPRSIRIPERTDGAKGVEGREPLARVANLKCFPLKFRL